MAPTEANRNWGFLLMIEVTAPLESSLIFENAIDKVANGQLPVDEGYGHGQLPID